MEYIAEENKNLKKIIRENEYRVIYLQSRLDRIAKYINQCKETGDNFVDYMCQEDACYGCCQIYVYDEIKCDCNMFCPESLCISCYNKLKKENILAGRVTICQNLKCNIWYCNHAKDDDVVQYSMIPCKDCNKVLCMNHYNETNIDLKNWICRDCCDMVKHEYGYESV